MKRILFTLLTTLLPLVAAAQTPFYIGAEAQWLNMKYNTGHGDNLLHRSTFGFNPIVGYKFNEHLGIELGFRHHSNHKTTTLQHGEISAGEVIGQVMSPAVFDTAMKLKGHHLNLVISTARTQDNPVQAFVGFGLSATKATFNRKTVQVGKVNLHHIFNRKIEKNKTLIRLMFGTHYYLTDNLALRASVVFEDTNKLIAFANDGIATARQPRILPKGSMNYGVGLIWSF